MSSTLQQVDGSGQKIAGARVDLAAAHRIALMDGLNEGTWNHFSLSVGGDAQTILLTPTYVHWSQVTASSLVEYGPDVREEDAVDRQAWVAYRIHYPIRAVRPDAACVMHAHPPYATALSMVDVPLNTAEQNAIWFHGRVARTEQWDLLAGPDLAQGKYIASQLGDADVLFLRNHGVLVVGETVAEAYANLYSLERACQAQVLAMSTGRPLDGVPESFLEAQVESVRSGAFRAESRDSAARHFEAMKRVLDEREPGYAS